MSFTDEQQAHELRAELRGFPSLLLPRNSKKVTLKTGDSIWFEGERYVVVKAIGGVLLENQK